MASLFAFVLALLSTPLSVHYQQLPEYAQAAYDRHDNYFRFVELWRLDAERKAFVAERQKNKAEMAEFWRKQAALDLDQVELRRKLEAEAKAKQNPGG